MLTGRRLSIGTLLQVFWPKISVTWGLVLVETLLLATLPLLLGRSIDGLIADDSAAFWAMIGAMAGLVVVGVARRAYDTRAYGTIRVEFGEATTRHGSQQAVSTTNARLDMSRELVDFLEDEAPLLGIALVHAAVAMVYLLAFHWALGLAAILGAVLSTGLYSLFAKRFFNLNAALNTQTEKQVSVLETKRLSSLREHLNRLRQHRVHLSDLEAIVYGLIFTGLLSMLAFNLWFTTTQTAASAGQVFAVVVYSYEFLESSLTLPMILQSITRLSEITDRINRDTKVG
ncbi:MAG: ABC transporter six-transmembrane domain-containing protein [Pseudomonadota bacterium]